jgi:hypothetical protein
MPRRQSLRRECLSLVSALYSAVTDPSVYGDRRAECEAWLFRHRDGSAPLTEFLRHQLARAAEARLVAREASVAPAGAVAVIAVDGAGTVMAASQAAWDVLRSGAPGQAPLRLPQSLVTHLATLTSAQGRLPRALRLQLDGGPGEVAALLLGVDDMPRRGTARSSRVATFVLWALEPAPVAAPHPAPVPHPAQAPTVHRAPVPGRFAGRGSFLRLAASDD